MGKNNADFLGIKNPNYKTGFAIKGKRSGFYYTWMNIKQKCYNLNNRKYKNYGGRGISVCQEWFDIKNFADWALNNGWRQGLSIDRIDNDGDYCPENCSWISPSVNSKRKSTTKITDKKAGLIRERYKNGETMKNLAKEYGVVHGPIWFIINNITHVKSGQCTRRLKELRVKKTN